MNDECIVYGSRELSPEKIDLLQALHQKQFYFPALGCHVTIFLGSLLTDGNDAADVNSDGMVDLLWGEYRYQQAIGGADE